MKNNFLSISKISFLWLFSASFCAAQQSENYTEKDWINYAKAQAYSYDFNCKAIDVVFNQENQNFRDSLKALNVFLPIIINGKKFRTVNSTTPVLDGSILYYYSTGNLAAEKSFKNNRQEGNEIFYFPNGKPSSINHFSGGGKDTARDFFANGQLQRIAYCINGSIIEDAYYWQNGQRAIHSYPNKNGAIVSPHKEFDERTKTIVNVQEFQDFKVDFFNLSGKEISEKKWFALKVIESKEIEYLPEPLANDNMSDKEMLDLFFAKRTIDERRFDREWDITSYLANILGDSLARSLRSVTGFIYVHPHFPNAMFFDTLAFGLNGSIFRYSNVLQGHLNGKLNYFYPDGSPLSRANYKMDLLQGDFVIYYPDGKISMKEKYNLGTLVDTSYKYRNNGVLEYIKVWADSGKYAQTYFWEDGKSIQYVKQCNRNYLRIERSGDYKSVRSWPIIAYYFYDKAGDEISKDKFRKMYPGIISDVKKTYSVRF